MYNFKTIGLIVFFCLLLNLSYSQEATDAAYKEVYLPNFKIKYDYFMQLETSPNKISITAPKLNFTNQNLLAAIDAILTYNRTNKPDSIVTVSDELNYTMLPNNNTSKLKLNKDAAIVIIRYSNTKEFYNKNGSSVFSSLNKINDTGFSKAIANEIESIKNKQNFETIYLTDEIINNVNTDSKNYLLNKRDLLLIFLDETVYSDSLNIKNTPSFFLNSLTTALTFISQDGFKGGQGVDTRVPLDIRLVHYSRNKIHPPTNFTFNVPILNKSTSSTNAQAAATTPVVKSKSSIDVDNGPFKTASIKIHELNHWAFTIGLSGTFLKGQNFNLKNDTVSVTLDSAQKINLSTALSVAIEYFPFGRDIDNFESLFQSTKDWYKRFGFILGVSLTRDPLKSGYLGGVFSFSTSFSFAFGLNYLSQINNNQSYSISNINSLSSFSDYFKRSYSSQFYCGINLSPAQAIKNILGK